MPKVVDGAQRREQIADAVFSLVVRGGVEHASLRNVATESGLNIGSVRHYVEGHDGMMLDAVAVLGERTEARILGRVQAYETELRARGVERPSLEEFTGFAVDLMCELLPLDAARRREVEVWLAFCERSRVHPVFAEAARAVIEGSRELARPLLAWAGVPEGDRPLRAEWLASVLDGLALGLVHDPDRMSEQEVREVLRRHFVAVVG